MHLRVRLPIKPGCVCVSISPPLVVRLLGGAKCCLQLRCLVLQSPSNPNKDRGSCVVVHLLGFALPVSSLLLLLPVPQTDPFVNLYDCPCCSKRPDADEVLERVTQPQSAEQQLLCAGRPVTSKVDGKSIYLNLFH